MTGPDLRALLTSWNISRGMLANAMALEGHHIEDKHVSNWTTKVPRVAEQLIERWRADPSSRPAHIKRPAVISTRRNA